MDPDKPPDPLPLETSPDEPLQDVGFGTRGELPKPFVSLIKTRPEYDQVFGTPFHTEVPLKEQIVNFMQNDMFKRGAAFLATIATGLIAALPAGTIAWKLATGFVGLASALGIVSTGTEKKE